MTPLYMVMSKAASPALLCRCPRRILWSPQKVSHPTAQDTMKELAGCKADVVLIHLNHTNPLFAMDSPERAQALAAGFAVSVLVATRPSRTSSVNRGNDREAKMASSCT